MTVPSDEPALRLLDYLDPASIHTGLAPRGKHETLRAMADFAVSRGLAQDAETLLDAVLRREEVVSTGVGNGVAIPHADLPEIESPSLVLGIIPEGVDFDALDEEPVYVVFLLLGTPRSPGLHMRILARIARLSKKIEFCGHLREATTAEAAYAALRSLELGTRA